jgi:hypothetical protein
VVLGAGDREAQVEVFSEAVDSEALEAVGSEALEAVDSEALEAVDQASTTILQPSIT